MFYKILFFLLLLLLGGIASHVLVEKNSGDEEGVQLTSPEASPSFAETLPNFFSSGNQEAKGNSEEEAVRGHASTLQAPNPDTEEGIFGSINKLFNEFFEVDPGRTENEAPRSSDEEPEPQSEEIHEEQESDEKESAETQTHVNDDSYTEEKLSERLSSEQVTTPVPQSDVENQIEHPPTINEEENRPSEPAPSQYEHGEEAFFSFNEPVHVHTETLPEPVSTQTSNGDVGKNSYYTEDNFAQAEEDSLEEEILNKAIL